MSLIKNVPNGDLATASGQKVLAALIDSANTVGRRPPPNGFNWDFKKHPVKISKDGPRRFSTDLDFRTKVNSDIFAGPVYFVSPAGSNANAGTSAGTAVRSLWKARQLLGASAALAGMIIALADPVTGIAVWDRNNDFNDTNGAGGAINAKPTKPFALMGVGGKHILGPIFPGLAWSFDATTRTYAVARGAVSSLNDISLLRDLGVITRLVRIAADTTGADAAARTANTRTLVAANPGTYAMTQDNNLVVRMARDTIVSDTTLAVVAQLADPYNPGPVDNYLSGFITMGGFTAGALAITDAADRNTVIEDCEILSAGADGSTSRNAVAVDKMNGFLGLSRVSARYGTNDLFNLHRTGSGSLHALMRDCVAVEAGRDGASPVTQSNQDVTLHEDVKLISLNTIGRLASGGCVRNIGSSQHWDLGSEYSEDRGDVRFGGTRTSIGVNMEDTAEYWGDCTTVRGCGETFGATANAKIHLRNPIEMGGRRSGSGLIDSY